MFFDRLCSRVPTPLPAHYLPSSEKFVDFIADGLAYGMLPDHKSAGLRERGRLVDLTPGCVVRVKRYWHCWNLKSELLASLTATMVQGAWMLLQKR